LATTVAVLAAVAGLGGAGRAKATTPALPASLGTATVIASAPCRWTYTLGGSIVVGSGTFSGTASGTATGPTSGCGLDTPRTPIAAFTLEGPDLTGTCSGHWLIDPTGPQPLGGLTPTNAKGVTPASVVSLACSLQLGTSAPAAAGLTLVLVSPSGGSSFTGVYGPGTTSVALPAPLSLGTVAITSTEGCSEDYSFVGDISLGGRVFHGEATASNYLCSFAPFLVTGTSPSGDLTASCGPRSYPLSGTPGGLGNTGLLGFTLQCSGHVGDGPDGTATLLVEVVMSSSHPGFEWGCGAACSTSDSTAVFVGV